MIDRLCNLDIEIETDTYNAIAIATPCNSRNAVVKSRAPRAQHSFRFAKSYEDITNTFNCLYNSRKASMNSNKSLNIPSNVRS